MPGGGIRCCGRSPVAGGAGYLTWGLFQAAQLLGTAVSDTLASPLFFGAGPHALFGPDKPAWWPATLPPLSAKPYFIAAFPLTFRATCYYYRGAVLQVLLCRPRELPGRLASLRGGYKGESKFPFVLQNLHRYTLYFGITLIVFLAFTTW